jgi:sulfoxide reductase catalytic subunit YedY
MLIRKRRAGEGDIPSSEITPYDLYVNRRQFLAQSAGLAAVAALDPAALAAQQAAEKQNTFEEITQYNNYYEFGTDKEDPFRNSGAFKPRPWSIRIEGECKKPGTYALDDFLKGLEVIEPVYRMRCVEAWSMVIPWRGVRLRDVIVRAEPTTVVRPEEMPGQRFPILPWPYIEGLRLDEALNELTILATGIYGKDLLNQNGAPIRLVVPWKYGFKGVKSIVKIRLVERMPVNTWQEMASNEYGFYANVNPNVDHPRWSQAKERRIGEEGGLFAKKRSTQMFNGYEAQVGALYAGMDLKKFF